MSQPKSSGARQVPMVLKGHTTRVWSVACSPDARSAVSGSQDQTVRIWDMNSASPRGEPFQGHTGTIYSVTYSPLGHLIASGSGDKTIRLWEETTGQQIGEPLRGHGHDVNSVAFSPSGNLIVSGSDDKTVRLWNMDSRQCVSNPFEGHSKRIWSVAFSPDSARVVSASEDETIRIWDVERGVTTIGPLNGHTGMVRSVTYSPDSSRVASGSFDNTIRFWDPRTGAAVGKPYEGHTNRVNSVVFSPNGTYIVSCSEDQTIRIWDVRTGKQVDEPFKGSANPVYSVAVSPCGGRIVSGSYDGTVMIWNLSNSGPDLGNQSNATNENNTTQSGAGGRNDSLDQKMSIQEMFGQLWGKGCANLTSQIDYEQDTPVIVNGGGVGDVWISKRHDGTKIFVKAWRTSMIERCSYEILKCAIEEIHTWSKMEHKNVHQLVGIALPRGQYLGLILEGMDNGNLHEYMSKHPQFDRHQTCIQVTLGLAYMHKHNMVHGDLKALNVLISSDGTAKLSGFGLSAISEACLPFSETINPQTGSARWVAPELLSEGVLKTKQSDVYALGMAILEIITGGVPYPQCRWEFQVLSKVMQGGHPTRPSELKDDEYGNEIWDLLVSCWDKNPSSRPSAKEMFGSLSLIPTD